LFENCLANLAAAHQLAPEALLILLAVVELGHKGQDRPSLELVRLQTTIPPKPFLVAVIQLRHAGLVEKTDKDIAATEAGILLLCELYKECRQEVSYRATHMRANTETGSISQK
jgi:hypothetical protein